MVFREWHSWKGRIHAVFYTIMLLRGMRGKGGGRQGRWELKVEQMAQLGLMSQVDSLSIRREENTYVTCASS